MQQSDLISRDLSWLKFNDRVLDQVTNEDRNLFDRLKFLAITSSNLDEFLSIRIGGLYSITSISAKNASITPVCGNSFPEIVDERTAHDFVHRQNECYKEQLMPLFASHGFRIIGVDEITVEERRRWRNISSARYIRCWHRCCSTIHTHFPYCWQKS